MTRSSLRTWCALCLTSNRGKHSVLELGRLARAFLLMAGALAFCSNSDGGSAQQAPFTVEHSVEWTRIVAVGHRQLPHPDMVLFSPDRAHFLVHTRRGDVVRNANVERVIVFEAKAVETYLRSTILRPPQGRILAEVLVQQDANELTSVTWIDEQRIGFLAEGDNRALQVFVADLATGSARQVTSSRTPVASFAIAGDTLLYYSHRDVSEALVRPVDDQIIYSVIVPPSANSTALELFKLSISSGVVRRIDLPAARVSGEYRNIWLSPRGRYGVVLTPALNVPNHWSEYRAGSHESRYTAGGSVVQPDSLEALFSAKLRYVLVDLDTGEVRPLLDAPSGSIAQTFGPTEVYWLDDEYSVIVSHTYLPLTGDAEERARRASGAGIAEVDLRSGAAVPIAWEPAAGSFAHGDFSGLVRSVDWDRTSKTLLLERQASSGAASERYRKDGKRWKQVKAPHRLGNTGRLNVGVKQALTERPRLYASTTAQVGKLLFDPNPGADALAFGQVEVMKWTDDNRLPWVGGLVYPTGYVAGRKYPLVLQTHGFRQDRFLLEGPGDDVGTAFAAQPLANAGFIVLQAGESPGAVTNDEHEARLVAQGWRAAIRELVVRGLVDPERVGIVAFSRTCMHAIRFLADFPDVASAVTLADGPWWGYGNQALQTNYPKAAVDEILGVTSGKPDPRRLQEWFDAQPLYALPGSRAAVRIEAMGPGAVVALWETFAILQNANRPVDMIYFRDGGHNLMKPAERIGSQQGNVDWLRFWLKGEEDADPTKAGQYERWRNLRDRLIHDQ